MTITLPKLYSPREAAEIIGVPVGTLSQARHHQRKGWPRHMKIGKLVRYRHDDLIAWLEKQTVTVAAVAE